MERRIRTDFCDSQGATRLHIPRGESDNTAFGIDALGFNSTGAYNTALGANALSLSGSTLSNTAVGYGAMGIASGNNNTAVSAWALEDAGTGSPNVAVPPTTNSPASFDLEAGDWVAPYGVGKHADMIFIRKLTMRSKRDYDQTLVVSFPNNGDGLQLFDVPDDERYCALLSPNVAPLLGYQAQVIKHSSEHPGETMVFDFDEKRNYFFRVRTVLDENGNIKSAQYGKIYGDFMHFTYYLNPTPDDRNLEYDPSQNLIPGQDVNAP